MTQTVKTTKKYEVIFRITRSSLLITIKRNMRKACLEIFMYFFLYFMIIFQIRKTISSYFLFHSLFFLKKKQEKDH